MNTRITLPLLTIAAATNALGCYSTWDLTPEMVWKLDGFDGATRKISVVQDGERKEVPFTSDTYLHFRDNKEQEVSAQFRALRLDGPVLVGLEQKTGDQFNVDLRKIKSVQASQLSPALTTMATAGYLAGLIPVGYGIVLGAFFSFAGSGGEGRPLRVAGRDAPVPAQLALDGRAGHRRHVRARVDGTTRAKLFARWAKAASEECASIPAFLALARDLKMASAPASLVQAALQAANEEAHHTRLCTKLANEHTELSVQALTPPIPENGDVDEASLIRRLALEAFWDGCVAEGAAATAARKSARLVTDDTTRLALQTIAHDETNHAALAQQILAYCLSVGGRGLRNTLIESFESRKRDEEAQIDAMAHGMIADPYVDSDVAGKYGLVETTVTCAARIETWEKNVAMLAAM